MESRGVRIFPALLIGALIATPGLAGAGKDYPKEEWPTFGGDYANTRFSQLAQINKGNVRKLELKWTFSTRLPADPVYNFETVPVIVDGIMYVTDPGNWSSTYQNVFAVNARTGQQLWHHQLPLDVAPETRGYFIARTNRGVAVGDGKVYLATLDAKLWALDGKTGDPVAAFGTAGTVRVADVFAGYVLTAAPVFVPRSLVPNGGPASGHNLVLIGTAGSENEARGYMNAYDADTGELVWRFFTVPDPSQAGGDTWPVISKGPLLIPTCVAVVPRGCHRLTIPIWAWLSSAQGIPVPTTKEHTAAETIFTPIA